MMVLNYEMVAFLAFGTSNIVYVCTLFNRPQIHRSNCTRETHINIGDTSHISVVNDRINISCQAPLLKHTFSISIHKNVFVVSKAKFQKDFLVSSILPKSEQKKFNLTTMIPQVELLSFVFWKN